MPEVGYFVEHKQWMDIDSQQDSKMETWPEWLLV